MKRQTFIAMLLGLVLVMSFSSTYGQTEQVIEADFIGTIDNERPFIEFPLRVPITGSTVTIDMARTSGDLDALLYLVDDKGSIVAENDDRPTTEGFAPSDALMVFPQASAGQYRIIATRFRVVEGESSGDFRILIDIEEPQQERSFRVERGDLLNAGFPIDFEPRPQARWTILAYYGSDNNLEGGVLQDLKEFEAGGGSTDDVQIIAMIDRSPDFLPEDEWRETRIYQVTAAKNPLGEPIILDSEVIVEFPLDDTEENRDMSDGELFAQFLVWGVQNFPAEDYVVAFASHGDGWKGVTADDTPLRQRTAQGLTSINEAAEFSLIKLPDLTQAFELARQVAGKERFGLLINDACLMGSAEYFAAVAPYFRYTLASPEIVITPALDMSKLVQFLNSPESGDIQSLGKQLVDNYMDEIVPARRASDTGYLTSALFDLQAFEELAGAIEAFAAVVNANPVVRGQELGKVRRNVYTYTAFSGFNDKIDLGDLMRDLIAISQDAEMIDAAEAVLEALDKTVVYGKAGELVQGVTSFYNIYFPEAARDFSISYFDQTPLKEWSRLLRSYYNSFTPQYWTGGGRELAFHAPTSPKIKITLIPDEPVSILNRPHISYDLVGRNIAKGELTVDRVLADGQVVRVFTEALVEEALDENGQPVRINQWSDGAVLASTFWAAHLPIVSDGINSAPQLMAFTESIVYLDGQYREVGRENWNDVTVSFDFQTRQFQRVINRSQSGGVAVVDIPVGSEFRTFRNLVSPDGAITREANTDVYIWPEGGLTWDFRPAPNGNYNIGISIFSFGGTPSFESASIVVNNDDLPLNLRGHNEIFGGYIVPLDYRWSSLSYSDAESLARSLAPDGSEFISIYYAFGLEAPTLEEIGDTIIENYAITRTSDYTAVEVDGENLIQFSFERGSGEDKTIGRMFIQLNTLNFGGFELGQGYAAEVRASKSGAAARLEELYAQILDTTFFDARAYQESGTSEWAIQDIGSNAQTLVRNTWTQSEAEAAEGWVRFSDPDNEGVFIESGTLAIDNRVAGGGNILSNIAAGRLVADLDGLAITGNQIYYGENVQWEAALYEGMRDDVAVTGRVYVTLFQENVYAVWVEAPQGDVALDVFPNVFEVFVDSYRLYE